jgi:hypothetical protein
MGRASSTRDVAFEVLDRVGPKTSLKFLVQEMSKSMDSQAWAQLPSAINMAAIYRSAWKRENKISVDARTHEDIPRRNMLNDNWVDVKTLNALTSFLSGLTAKKRKEFERLIQSKSFHSLPHLLRACKLV